MVLGSNQPLVKISTRNIPGDKGGRCVRLTTYHNTVPLSRYQGALSSQNSVGLFRPVKGQLYLYLYTSEYNQNRMRVEHCGRCSDWTTGWKNWSSNPQKWLFFFFLKTYRLSLGPTYLSIQCVPQLFRRGKSGPEREAPSSVEFKNKKKSTAPPPKCHHGVDKSRFTFMRGEILPTADGYSLNRRVSWQHHCTSTVSIFCVYKCV